jgi:small multidrug resistance family-3 protein
MIQNLAVFAAAALLEIAGCFAFWLWLRRGVTGAVAVLGVAALVGFALVLTRSETPFAGRAYAAYGGIYIAASLAWLWVVEGQRPTTPDAIGAAIAVAGAVTIVTFGARTP